MHRVKTYVALIVMTAAGLATAYVAWPATPAARATRALSGVEGPALGQRTSRADLARTIAAARVRLAANPADAQSAVALADALLRTARVESNAAAAIDAEKVLKAVLREEPGEYTALKMLGAVYLSQHRFRDAIEVATRARGIRGADTWNDGVLGDAWLELGDYDRAFEAFDRMVRRRPDAAAYARIAYAHELQGRLPEALTMMQMAAEATSAHDPESLAWHHAQLGNLRFQMGDVDGASREYARADHAFPGHPYARVGRARVAAARGDVPRALALYRELMDASPTPELAATIGDLLVTTGDAAGAQKMYDQAEALEREGWKSEEPQPAALARLLAERNLETADAVQLAERAAADRADIHTMDALAWAYFRAGRFEDARAAARQALRTGTADRRILYHAAAIERALGNRDEARTLVARALAGHRTFDPLVAPAAEKLARALGPS